MPTIRPKRPSTGRHFDELHPGKFYQSAQPGGFTDSLTGIHIPGPKVAVDPRDKRTPTRVTKLPVPIQVPTHKIVMERNKESNVVEERKVVFNRRDDENLHEGLQQALQCGVIAEVPDEHVAQVYPDAWEARETEIIFDRNPLRNAASVGDLLRDAEERIGGAQRDILERQEEIAARSAFNGDNDEDEDEDLEETEAEPASRASKKRGTPPPPPPPPQ